ncbi:MAG: VanW family protein [Oscillospiraceae bacterium]|jgi:vancomycin resistance protein YoaR|nr:VanW family protein [Oscillospiraceae bacterium]MCI1990308.1 VanW family protein [Oscillospiraceae bacterium]MCI2034587.1 VanW family protein [Oscillospiraceae bacterium]
MAAGTSVDSVDIYSDSGKKKKARGRMIAILVAAAVVCAGVCAVVGRQVYDHYQHEKLLDSVLNTDRFYSGIVVQGVGVGGMTMQQAREAVKAKEASARGDYNVKITYEGKNWGLTRDDMSFSYDTESVLKKAYAYGRSGSRDTRYAQVTALKTHPKKYSVTASPDEAALKAKVEKIASEVNRKPVDPTVISFSAASRTFAYKDGVEGLSVDTDRLWSGVKAAVESAGHAGTVQMQVKKLPFSQTMAAVKGRMKKLGSFSTTSTNNASGTYNMKKALQAVNGTCIPAGKTFSFFGTVGPCDKAHGYREAGAILKGKLVQDYGGGICQASTTIYGAALRSNMKIVERHNHSLPSSYCPIGQDATVSYPDLDLKFQNTTAYPVYIVTSTGGKSLTASFYGYQSPDYDEIKVVSSVDKTIPAPSNAQYTADSSLSPGTVKLDSKARKGYRASARRVFYKNGKQVKTENLNFSYYPPKPAYYSYGKGSSAKSASSSSGGSQDRPDDDVAA